MRWEIGQNLERRRDARFLGPVRTPVATFLGLVGCAPTLGEGVYARRVTDTPECGAYGVFPDVRLSYDGAGEALEQEWAEEGVPHAWLDQDSVSYRPAGDSWLGSFATCADDVDAGVGRCWDISLEVQPLSRHEYNWTIELGYSGEEDDCWWVGKGERAGNG